MRAKQFLKHNPNNIHFSPNKIMETIKEINEKILAVTQKIRDNHPELAKHLDEMPNTIPNEKDPEMTVKKLNEYLESLKKMLKDFASR